MLRMAKRKAGYKSKIKRGGVTNGAPGAAADNGLDFKFKQKQLEIAALNAQTEATRSNLEATNQKIQTANQLRDSASERSLETIEKANRTIDLIKNFFGGMFGWMFRSEFPLAHYITLFIVILILFGAFRIGMSGSIPNLRIVSTTNSIVNAIKRFLKKYFGWLIPSTYRISLLSNLFTPFGSDKLEGIPRTTIGGRCDNVLLQTDGNSCHNTSTPKAIQWVIDPDNIPEMNELPQNLLDSFTGNGNRLVVSIPYESTGLYYTPNCDKMKFADGAPAQIFNQRGLSDTMCRFSEKASTVYKTKMNRQNDQSDVYKLCTA